MAKKEKTYRRGVGIKIEVKDDNTTKCERCGFKHNLAKCKICNYKRYYRGMMTHNKKCKCKKCYKKKEIKKNTKFTRIKGK